MQTTAVHPSPRVSIVMPVYDPHPIHFREAVDSLLCQTLTDFELLIVEDPSPRSARTLLQGINDPRVRLLLNPKKRTLVDSRNWGLAEASGEYVACADADDVYEPERLEKQCAYLRNNPQVDVLGSQLAIIDAAGALVGYRNYPLAHEAIFASLAIYSALAQPSVIFKKSVVVAAGGYRQFFNEDYELWSRLAAQGARFANHPEALVRYRVIPEGIRSAKVRNMLRGTLEVKRLHWRGRLGLAGGLRMWAERGLLWLPPRLVLYLFMKTQFRAASRTAAPAVGLIP